MSMESDPTAVMGRRLGAVTIDGAIAFGPALAVFFGSMTTRSLEERQDRDFRILDAEEFCDEYMEQGDGGHFCFYEGDDVYYTESGILSAGLVLYGIAIALHVVLQSITGGSIGKLLTGIRVVDEHGNKAGFGRNLVRWLLWLVDSLPFLALVGLITSLTSSGHRRVGDMVAKTYVVRASAVGRPVVLGQSAVPPPATWTPAPTAKPGPQWDEARGTYIQWDPEAQAWMQWDEAAKRWDPIQAATPTIPPPPPAAPPPPPPPPSTPPPPPPA